MTWPKYICKQEGPFSLQIQYSCIGLPIVKIRQHKDYLVFTMQIPNWYTSIMTLKPQHPTHPCMYRQISNISRTKSQNLMFFISFCSGLCAIYWSQVLSREWRCSWCSADRRCSNYIWVIDNFIAKWGAPYIRGFTVIIHLHSATCASSSFLGLAGISDIPKWYHWKLTLCWWMKHNLMGRTYGFLYVTMTHYKLVCINPCHAEFILWLLLTLYVLNFAEGT